MAKTKARTSTDIKFDIRSLIAEQQQIGNQLTALETKIADSWGKDTSKLEAEYGQTVVRLNASNRVLERLEQELAEQTIADLIAEFQARERERLDARQLEATAQADRDSAREMLQQTEARLQDAARRNQNISGTVRQLEKRLLDAGLTQDRVRELRRAV